jgi:hypothetical protein
MTNSYGKKKITMQDDGHKLHNRWMKGIELKRKKFGIKFYDILYFLLYIHVKEQKFSPISVIETNKIVSIFANLTHLISLSYMFQVSCTLNKTLPKRIKMS